MMEYAGKGGNSGEGFRLAEKDRDQVDGAALMNRMASQNQHGVQPGSMVQVTQTRRTIFPSPSFMRTLSHDMHYQQPGQMLDMHTYLRCSTEQLLNDRSSAMEEIQQLKYIVDTREEELRKMQHELTHEKAFTSHLKDKVELFQASVADHEARTNETRKHFHRMTECHKQLSSDMQHMEEKLDKFSAVQQREFESINEETRKAKASFDGILHSMNKATDDHFSAIENFRNLIERRIKEKCDIINREKQKIDRVVICTKKMIKARVLEESERQELRKQVSSFSAQLEQSNKKIVDLSRQKDLSDRKYEDLENNYDDIKRRFDHLSNERDAWEGTNASTLKEKDSLKQKLRYTTDEFSKCKSELSLATSRLERALTENEKSKADVSEMAHKHEEFRISFDKQEILLASKDENIAERDKEIQRLLEECTSIKDQFAISRTTLTQKQNYFDEALSLSKNNFEKATEEMKLEHKCSMEKSLNEYNSNLEKARKTHMCEIECEKEKYLDLTKEVEFLKKRDLYNFEQYQEKEAIATKRYVEAEKTVADLKHQLLESEKKIDKMAEEGHERCENHEQIQKTRMENLTISLRKEADERLKSAVSEKEAELEARHKKYSEAATKELESIRRQHQDELQKLLQEHDSMKKVSDNLESNANLKKRNDLEFERRIEDKYKNLAKRSASEKDKRFAKEVDEIKKIHQKEMQVLKSHLAEAEEHLSLYRKAEFLHTDEKEVMPPIIHTSNKIEEVTRNAHEIADTAMQKLAAQDIKNVHKDNTELENMYKRARSNETKNLKHSKGRAARSTRRRSPLRDLLKPSLMSPKKVSGQKSPSINKSKRSVSRALNQDKSAKNNDPFLFSP